ncbi:hypothetical protein PR048_010596 [Dryococelus australis]|uniref:Uncharacterized protein n=1 Tax=Dryococelus australis TaxID=614101 RepID=A0ABQ9I372_9NEOP|nr:hypothetical protein PR048_010596 [Dryococelus australis]
MSLTTNFRHDEQCDEKLTIQDEMHSHTRKTELSRRDKQHDIDTAMKNNDSTCFATYDTRPACLSANSRLARKYLANPINARCGATANEHTAEAPVCRGLRSLAHSTTGLESDASQNTISEHLYTANSSFFKAPYFEIYASDTYENAQGPGIEPCNRLSTNKMIGSQFKVPLVHAARQFRALSVAAAMHSMLGEVSPLLLRRFSDFRRGNTDTAPNSILPTAIGCCILEKAFPYFLTWPLRIRQHRHGSYVIRV